MTTTPRQSTARGAVVRATAAYQRVLAKVTADIGAGPGYVKISQAAAKKQLSSMTPDERIALAGIIGDTAMLELMKHASSS